MFFSFENQSNVFELFKPQKIVVFGLKPRFNAYFGNKNVRFVQKEPFLLLITDFKSKMVIFCQKIEIKMLPNNLFRSIFWHFFLKWYVSFQISVFANISYVIPLKNFLDVSFNNIINLNRCTSINILCSKHMQHILTLILHVIR